MSDPIMTDDGIDWLEYMRGIENGNVVPTLEHLKAVCKAAREDHYELAAALQELMIAVRHQPVDMHLMQKARDALAGSMGYFTEHRDND